MDTLFDQRCPIELKYVISNIETNYSQGNGWNRTNSEHVECYKKLLETLNFAKSTTELCFTVVLEGTTSYGNRNHIYCVFRHFIIYYMSDNQGNQHVFPHTHSVFVLQILKWSKLKDNSGGTDFNQVVKKIKSLEDSTNSLLEVSEKELQIKKTKIQRWSERIKKDREVLLLDIKCMKEERDAFEQEKQKFTYEVQVFEKEKNTFKTIQGLFHEVVEKEKTSLRIEKEAFEKEKQELKTELAKYKGIVLNCQREIQAYGF